MPGTGSGRNSVVHHTVYQISFQLSDCPGTSQNVFLGTVLSDAATWCQFTLLEAGVDNHQRCPSNLKYFTQRVILPIQKNEPAMQSKLIVKYRRQPCQWLYQDLHCYLLWRTHSWGTRKKSKPMTLLAWIKQDPSSSSPIYANQNGAKEMLLITACYTQLAIRIKIPTLCTLERGKILNYRPNCLNGSVSRQNIWMYVALYEKSGSLNSWFSYRYNSHSDDQSAIAFSESQP